MNDLKKKSALSLGALALVASGALAQRAISPPLATIAKPSMMRWLDEGEGKPSRYAIAIVTKAGANPGSREIVCDADGTNPKLNGVTFDNANAKELCAGAVAFNKVASEATDSMTSLLVR